MKPTFQDGFSMQARSALFPARLSANQIIQELKYSVSRMTLQLFNVSLPDGQTAEFLKLTSGRNEIHDQSDIHISDTDHVMVLIIPQFKGYYHGPLGKQLRWLSHTSELAHNLQHMAPCVEKKGMMEERKPR